ncbi:MAG: (2Fe-2S)-binding protein [Desulfohalobiaceae bacterium]|nr:(2Fe-2S)-binding protein [Desulfohalobiaceae bacterium]
MPLKNQDQEQNRSRINRRVFLKTMGVGTMSVCLEQHLARASNTIKSGREVPAGKKIPIDLIVNQNKHHLLVEARWSLLFVLRDKLGLTGSKQGCGRGECGACTVLINSIPRYACLTLAVEAQGMQIETVEGLMDGEDLGPVQQAFLDEDAFQCGYCTPGQVVAAEGLLRKVEDPDAETLRLSMSGNLCRCGAYVHIEKAVKKAAQTRSGR